MEIVWQYPPIFLGGAVLAGAAYAALLYWREKTFAAQPRWQRGMLEGLRWAAVSLIVLLLLAPLVKYRLTETKKPIVVLAQDNSASVAAGLSNDSSSYRSALAELSRSLSAKYEFRSVAFGSSVREDSDFNFQDKNTNLSDLVDELGELYANQHLAAVIIASDGIYNEGSNPIYGATKLGAPIFTIALGDTTPRRDLSIKKVYYNNIVYLDDKFTLQADLSAYNCAGAKSTLTISKVVGGNVQVLKTIPYSPDKLDYFKTEEIELTADQAGVQRYRLSLAVVQDEVSTLNNVRDIFVEVLDARQKILLLAQAPHPDLAALRQSITLNKNYEVAVDFASKFKGKVSDYDLVVLHQLPAQGSSIEPLMAQLQAERKPRLFIVGAQSDLVALSKMQNTLSIKGNVSKLNEVGGLLVSGFTLFNVNTELLAALKMFPPLTAPFGEFKAGGNASVLLQQKIGMVETQYPLLAFSDESGLKTGVWAAEGLWKWKYFNYLQFENNNLFDELIGKTIQYLSVKEDKRRFRIFAAATIFDENDDVQLDAELYNESYELVNEPEASITITDEANKAYNFNFSKTEKAYTLKAGILPVGNYRYEGNTSYGGKALKAGGQFAIQPIQSERFDLTADHRLLALLSEKTGGKMVMAADLAKLQALIDSNGGLKPLYYESYTTRSLLHFKWIFFLILGLLSLEWFSRRYLGAY